MVDEEGKKNILNNSNNCIIIKNLDPSIDVSQIHYFFANFGEIISCKMPTNIHNECLENECSSYGYCFVCFRNPEDAKIVISDLNNSFINGIACSIEPISIKINEVNNGDVCDGCSSLAQITTSSSIAKIGLYAFARCSSLTQIEIPPFITSIEYNAFARCSSLTQIEIPLSITSIGNSLFLECLSLTQISIPSSVTEIEDYTFSYCSSLKQLTVPSSVTSIGNCTFYGCSSLVQITIPSSVISIGNSAFEGCSSLAHITIPSSVILIGDYSFCKCSSLLQITIPSNLKTEKFGLNPQTKVIKV